MLPNPDAITTNGASIAANCAGKAATNTDVIRTLDTALVNEAGFLNLKGNLFDSAIMKTSVISDSFRLRYLSNPDDLMAFEGRAIVFDGPEDFHNRIDDPAENIDVNCVLFMRGTGPKGYPGGGEVVNTRAPSYLLTQGVEALPCVGDGRQSGTSGSPSILNASPEAADGGGLALLQTGDRVRFDLGKGTADMLVPPDVLADRARALTEAGGYQIPESQTPWQQYFRELTGGLSTGMTLRDATSYRNTSRKGLPRDSH